MSELFKIIMLSWLILTAGVIVNGLAISLSVVWSAEVLHARFIERLLVLEMSLAVGWLVLVPVLLVVGAAADQAGLKP